MQSLLERLLNSPWAYHVRLDWIATTAAAAIVIALQVGQRAGSQGAGVREPGAAKGTLANSLVARRTNGTARAILCLTLLAAFLALYIAMNLVWEDFDYYDNDYFTIYTLHGKDIPMPIWLLNGRFFPFGEQEFNIIRHFTNTPAGYHVLPIAQLFVFVLIILILDLDIQVEARVIVAIFRFADPEHSCKFHLTGRSRTKYSVLPRAPHVFG